jgi:hypothetical protein
VLDSVDDVLVSLISFATVGRRSDDYHRSFANANFTGSVLGYGYVKVPLLASIGNNVFDHFGGHWFMRFVLQVVHSHAVIVVAYFAAKQYYGTGSRVMRLPQQTYHIKRCGR